MFHGTTIEDLIAAVERAEEHARSLQAESKVDPYEIPIYQQLAYETPIAIAGVA